MWQWKFLPRHPLKGERCEEHYTYGNKETSSWSGPRQFEFEKRSFNAPASVLARALHNWTRVNWLQGNVMHFLLVVSTSRDEEFRKGKVRLRHSNFVPPEDTNLGGKWGNANRAGKTLNGPTSSIPFSCSSCSFHKIARYFERGPNSKYARKFLRGCSSLNGVPIHGPIQARPFLPVLRELRLLSLSPPNRRWTRPRRLRSLFLPSPAGNALALAFPQFSFSPDFRYLK